MRTTETRDAIVIGAGVSGIYAIKRLIDEDFDAVVLEADDDLGGTWYRNRYPGCRFDSESYTYGYSFSQELLDEWDWTERFSPQPENLRYLNYVADKFDLRRHMQFNARVESMTWDDDTGLWHLRLTTGEEYITRFVIGSLGPLSIPTLPRIEGIDDFEGHAFHTYHWPTEPFDLTGKRVGVVGTGATGIQVISAIAGEVGELKVFQRRPNWSTPLNNGPISAEEMADIRSRFDEIFELCASSPGGFIHRPRHDYDEFSPTERRKLWDELYDTPGFALWAGNFVATIIDEDANRELSDYVADRIRGRVNDPATAEKLIPTDHGFGIQRVPLETNYYEVYNRDHVALVDLSETPIQRVTATGIETSDTLHELDVIVFATGFDAITGGYDRIDVTGVDGLRLADKWAEGPSTYYGLFTAGFPNLCMVAGPQSVSGSSNFPRAIEGNVDWFMELLTHARDNDIERIEAETEAEQAWLDEVKRAQDAMLIHNGKGWFTGYNSNIVGRDINKVRYQAYFGGAPKFNYKVAKLAAEGYPGLSLRSRAT